MTRIRVLVVDDSLTVRRRLVEVLTDSGEFEVIGEAGDGRSAIELCRTLRPDVVTLDIVIPELNGLAVTEHVMAHSPTPILIVSSSTNRGDLFDVYAALAAGAVDVLDKSAADDPAWEQTFKGAVRMVSRIKVISHPRGRRGLFGGGAAPRMSPGPTAQLAAIASAPRDVIAVGASTGGPSALVDVLASIPLDVQAPILVVLHIDAAFSVSFAEWLGGQIKRPTVNAVDGERLADARGRIVLAPADHHLIVEGPRLRLVDTPPRNFCRPSVDVLFESLAREHGANVAAALLTGMGRDGAAGLLAIRQAGGATIAQDEASCIVYGMPREAVMLGAAERVLPLTDIGRELGVLARANGKDPR